MEASEFEARKQELMEECTIRPEVFVRLMPRLERFMVPFVGRLARKEQIEHARTFVRGLLSDLEHKNAESIAYLFGQERMPLQHFLGVSCWDDKPLRDELVSQIGKQLGEVDGVIVFDPSAFPKSGCDSVGVARQWCGRLGKVDNCQVGIFMGYVSSREHALVDMRLYLPKEWTNDRKRREKAGVPKEIRYRTRHELCLEMLAEHAQQLPHQWITGDDEMGRPSLLLFRLLPNGFSNRDLRKQYALLLGKQPDVITPGQMTYQLRRLRLRGFIVRIPKSHRYEVTDAGIRTAVSYATSLSAILRPLTATNSTKPQSDNETLPKTLRKLQRLLAEIPELQHAA